VIELILKEVVLVSILLLLVTVPVMKIQHNYYPGDIASHQKYWISTIIGILDHLLCEFSGINKYYCKYGNACR
jgi:hypothetical protein